MVWCNLCFLDARHFQILPKFIDQIKQVKSSANNEAVIFLLKLPAQHVKLWRDVLTRTFSEQQGYQKVKQYYCEDEDDNTVGQAIICLGELQATTVILHVEILQAPPAFGCAEFNESMVYVELQVCNPRSATKHTIGILWSPDLFCVDKLCFNETNYQGVTNYMVAALALQRSQVLRGCSINPQEVPCVNTAIHTMKSHLEGLLVVTDMRSNYFGESYPLHQWRISGKVHAVQGLFANGSFQDTCTSGKLACAPPCYRLRPRAKPYYLTNHSFEFWSEDFLSRTVQKPPVTLEGIVYAREECLYVNNSSCVRNQTSVCPDTCSPSSIADSTHTTASPDTSPASASSASSEMYGDPLEQDPGPLPNEIPYETEPECMVCLSRKPIWVFESCGHRGVCGECRKWMCKAQFNKNKSEQCRVSPANLTMDKAGKVMLQCPYCRRSTRAVHHNGYQGTTYNV